LIIKILTIFKNIFTKILFRSQLNKIIIVLSCLFLLSACSDEGCIEADDFGEYETQILTIDSNISSDNCTYNSTLQIDDPSQGAGLVACFTTGSPILTDIDNHSPANISTIGCAGFKSDPTFLQLCIDYCRQKCNDGATANITVTEPAWQPTAGDNTMVISPLDEVYISTLGNVNLGSVISMPSTYIAVDTPALQSLDSNWANTILDVKNNQSRQISFSGQWSDGSNSFGSADSSIIDKNIYNSSRLLAAYVIPAPSGYDFDYTQNNEIAGAKGVPLTANPNLWQCNYSGSSLTDATCFSKNYDSSNGYNNIDNNAALNLYNITSDAKSSNLGSVGGMIRWQGDNLVASDSSKAFASINCDNGCSSPSDNMTGQIIGDLSFANGVTITNPNNYAVLVSLKSLISSNNCGSFATPLNLNITVNSQLISVPVENNSWVNNGISNGNNIRISLEANQSLNIAQNNTKYGSVNCGNVIAAWFLPYQDIEIKKSGFLNFNILGDNNASGNCTLIGRIINPNGSHIDDLNTGLSADFYEYGDFNASNSLDPLNNLLVPVITSGSGNWSSSNIMVRKGQIIRFASESWKNTWNSKAGPRQCGIGMAMSITERPALLCRGFNSENVTNNDLKCIQDFVGGKLVGCKAISDKCTDNSTSSRTNASHQIICNTSSSNTYCPKPDCQSIITCSNGTADNLYTKTNCQITPSSLSNTDFENQCSSFTDPISTITSNNCVTQNSCANCANSQLQNAQLSAQIAMPSLIQCYDLENYTGKVSNIPALTGFSADQLSDFNQAKGATILGSFNGSYGNFSNFSVSNSPADIANNNVIYDLTAPLIFSEDGRLKFLVLNSGSANNNDFLNLSNDYASNTTHGSVYTGTNGYKISFNGQMNFSNGGWLEAMICQESSNSSNDCGGQNPPKGNADIASNDSNVPRLVELNDSTPTTALQPTSKTSFSFNSNGILTKSKSVSTAHDALAPVGSNFYVHDLLGLTSTDMKNLNSTQKDKISRLRLTFKIKDPENPNCSYNGGINNGVLLANPAYSSINNCNIDAVNSCYIFNICSGNNNPNSSCYTTPSSQNHSPAFDGKICNINGTTGCVLKDTACSDADGVKQITVNLNGVNSTSCVLNTLNSKAICGANESPSLQPSLGQTQCVKQYYCGSAYSNNSGKYTVIVKIKDPNNSISNIVAKVIDPVVTLMDGSKDGTQIGQAQKIYNLLISDIRYKSILNMTLVLMFTFYGLGYLMGVSEFTHGEIMTRIIKIGVIYLFVGPYGWDWFNSIVVQFFKHGTDYVAFLMATSFDNSPYINEAIKQGNYYDKSILFSSVDQVFGMFFSHAMQAKISALLFASVFGFIYLYIIYLSFFLYIYAIANAILLYITAQIFISLLFILGPIFFIFLLFNHTKKMFDNWLKALIGFSLQQIFLLTTLSFFNMMMYEVIKMSMGYKVCWGNVWTINIITRINLLSWWTLASLPPRTNPQSQIGQNIGQADGIPSLFSILYIWIIASLMHKFVTFMTDLANNIANSIKASSIADGVKGMTKTLRTQAINLKNYAANNTKIGRAISSMPDKLDDKLFDTGKDADKRRKEVREQKAKDINNRTILRKAGNEAVSDYKKQYGAELAKMSKEDADKTLNNVRDKAMEDTATHDLKLNSKEFEQIKNTKTTGVEKLKGNRSLNEEKVTTTFSRFEIEAAMSNTNKEGREALIKATKEGNIKVGKSRSEIAATAVKFMLNDAEAYQDVSKAASKAVEAIKHDSYNMTQYNKAVKQLIEQGKIRKFAFGTGWSRNDVEKDMIKKQIKQNKEQSRPKELEISSITTSAYVAKRAEVHDALAKTEANQELGIREAGTFKAAIFGREKVITAPMVAFRRSQAKDKKQDAADAKDRAINKNNSDQLDQTMTKRSNAEEHLFQARQNNNAVDALQLKVEIDNLKIKEEMLKKKIPDDSTTKEETTI
jgi:type IV secretory pathway VirB6-like protein